MHSPAQLLVLLAALLAAGAAAAGVYDNPRNLQVLPKQISADELRKTMKAFSLGVGARCQDCHASKPGQTWEQFDYPSDEKPLKDIARQMLRMTDDINGRYLARLDAGDHTRVRVSCVTCHRGQRLPRQIDEVLDEALTAGRLPAAIEKYGQLRKEFYGSHTYDFTELSLTEYARALNARGDVEAAFGIASLAAREFPASFMPHYLLGELRLQQGDRHGARTEFEKALQLAPDQTWIRTQIDKLDQ